MARDLSESGKAYLRRNVKPEHAEEMERYIAAIPLWEPRPPAHAPGKLSRLTEHAKEVLRRHHVPESLIAEVDAWAEQREQAKARGQRTTMWTPERMKATDKSTAERARRYRERRRLAKLAMEEAARQADVQEALIEDAARGFATQ